MDKKRSAGITVVGIIMLVYSIWLLGSGLLTASLDRLFLGLLYLIPSFGILRFKQGARKFSVYLSGFISVCLIIIALTLFFRNFDKTLSLLFIKNTIMPLLPSLFFFIYFTHPTVKGHFR